MSKKIFALFLALFMLLQIPAVVDALDDFGIETTAEAATYKLKKPVISKLTNVSGGVKVQWGKVSGAANYRVMYKTSSSGSWKTAGTTTSTSYTFKNVSSGKTYYFTVRCVSKSGKTATSGYDKTGEKIKYIAKPVIKSLSNTSTGVKITWGKVAGAAKYRVLLKTSSGWKTVADTTSTSYTYKTTNSGKKYTFSVRCVSSTGKSYTSYYDTTGKSITFIAKPVLKKISSTETGVKLTWNAVEGAYKYRVLRKTSDGWKKITDTAKTGYTYKNVTDGKAYTLTVRCIDKNGNFTSYYDTAGKKITYEAPAGTSDFLTSDNSDGTLTIIGYIGSDTAVTIPASIRGKKVTCIGADAFVEMSALTSVSIPTGVTSIEAGAFVGCSNLNTVSLPDTLTQIGDNVFTYCESLGSIQIPDSVYRIGEGVFAYTHISRIKLPPKLTEIKACLFEGCFGLTEVQLPDGITSIGDYAFFDCTSLASIDLPDGISSIGLWAFSGCSALDFSLPDSLRSIGYRAFSGTAISQAIIPKGVKTIPYMAFSDCAKLSRVSIPSSVSSIEKWAFNGCPQLSRITVPNSVTSIGYGPIDGDLSTPFSEAAIISCHENSYAHEWCVSNDQPFELN